MKQIISILSLLFSSIVIGQSIKLSPKDMDTLHVRVMEASYKGKQGVRVLGTNYNASEMAILKNIDFSSGTIDIDVSGDRLPQTDTSFRGFIGIAFRIKTSDTMRYECFFLRPTLGRMEDQLRRNHSVQYMAAPNYGWPRLRDEEPGVYETYSDMVPGEWIHLHIVIKNDKARLFINNTSQPSLVVNDMKNTDTNGSIALWIGPGTDGYFSNLIIHKE